MSIEALAAAAALSDQALLARLEVLASRERENCAQVVAHLAELDTRTTLLAAGYSSLFTYCTHALRYSEHSAYNRIDAARLVRRLPLVLERLKAGSVNLTTARLLSPHLTEENHRRVLDEASGRSKREVEEIVARLAPRADVQASIRRLPSSVSTSPATTNEIQAAAEPILAGTRPAASAGVSSPSHQSVVAPLAPERYRIQLTVGRDTHDRLRRLQDLLRREIPDGDPAAIVERALALLETDVVRRKRAATSRPRHRPGTRSGTSASRHIPADVARAAWARDGERCAFVSPTGRRCDARVYLELHHLRPYMTGGEATVENIAVRCQRHNLYEAERVFGPIREARARKMPSAASG